MTRSARLTGTLGLLHCSHQHSRCVPTKHWLFPSGDFSASLGQRWRMSFETLCCCCCYLCWVCAACCCCSVCVCDCVIPAALLAMQPNSNYTLNGGDAGSTGSTYGVSWRHGEPNSDNPGLKMTHMHTPRIRNMCTKAYACSNLVGKGA